MDRKMNLLTCLVIFSQINRSWTAIFLNFGDINSEDDYTRSRSASVYRGLLLSYSPDEKQGICEDLFYAQLYTQRHGTAIFVAGEGQIDTTPLISDGETTEGKSQYRLTVTKLVTRSKPNEEEDISFTCIGKYFKYRKPNDKGEYILSTAFRPSSMYSIDYSADDTAKGLQITSYIGLSAKHVPLHETQLEDQYATIRQTMRTLQKESPEYMRLIARKDKLRSLTRHKKLVLCASILSTPTYRDDKLEMSLDWINQNEDKLEHYKKLTFKEAAYTKDEFFAECVYCKGFADGDDYVFGESTNLYFTQNFDDQDSVIVLKEDNVGRVFLSKYFRKVPVLVNANEPIAEGTLSQNFDSFRRAF